MALDRYRRKRDFGRTPEPKGRRAQRAGGRVFVVHKHAARSLHYDLRLELRGVLVSFAVPKGPPRKTGEKRLAVRTEDHPLEYANFEGEIPAGQYGAGKVEIWDRGTWEPEGDAARGLAAGKLDLVLDGERLRGRWSLVRFSSSRSPDGRDWLLIKRSDRARPGKGRRAPPGASSQADPAEVAGVRLSNASRVLFPELDATKRDLALYYEAVAEHLLPHVAGRPLSVLRCPEGPAAGCFYQKHLTPGFGASVRGFPVHEHEKEGKRDYLGIDDLTGLIELVQHGVVELHPFGARADRVDRPDRVVLDLDPGPGVAWARVVAAARALHELALELGLAAFLRTTGGKGLHVVLPIERRSDWDGAKEFARELGAALARRDPKAFVLVASKARRGGRIYVDYLRNARGATAVASYSVRARAGAPVATPLAWDELTPRLDPARFDLRGVPRRLAALTADPWKGFFETRQPLTAALMARVRAL